MRSSNVVLIVIAVLMFVAAVALVAFGTNAAAKTREALDHAMVQRERAVMAELEALEARAEAERQAEIARVTTEFLRDLLGAADPARAGDVTMAEVLDRAEQNARERLDDQPELRERVLEIIERARREMEGGEGANR